MENRLLKALEGMVHKEVNKFVWHLKNLTPEDDGFDPIAKADLENPEREDIAGKIVEIYEERALNVTRKILKKMKLNKLASTLEGAVPKQDAPDQGGASSSEVMTPPKAVTADDEEKFYKMTSMPRGICVIINNQRFESPTTKNRDGSNIDVVELAKVFSLLGFKVLMCQDKSEADMKLMLNLFSKPELSQLRFHGAQEWRADQREFTGLKELPQHGDAFICCLLSHGTEDGVCGTDGIVLPTDQIFTTFNSSNCRQLAGKPKVFIIQACRGRGRMAGVAVEADGEPEPELEEDTTLEYPNIPAETDLLVLRATVNKHVSLRNTVTGSWFIQTLCRLLEKGCLRNEEVFEILTEVNKAVSKKETTMNCKVVKQASGFEWFLRKRLIFPIPQ